MCKVSFIIPVYNTEQFIGRCLDSILCQEYGDYEIICIDDSSTDSSLQILNEYSNKNPQIKVMQNTTNKGVANVRNCMLNNASGDYIWFVDSDDYIKEDSLEVIDSLLRKYNPDVLLFGTEDLIQENLDVRVNEKRSLDINSTISGKELFLKICKESEISTSSCDRVFRRNYLIEGGYSYENQIIGEDELFTLKTLIEAKVCFSTSEKFYVYNHRQGSATTKKISMKQLSDRCKTILGRKEYLKYLDGEVFVEAERLIYKWEDYIKRHIAEVEYIDRAWILKEKKLSSYLATLLGGVYGGFFPYLLAEESMSLLRNATKIYVYGAGNIGQAFVNLVEDRGIKIDAFIISDRSDSNECMGYPLLCIEDIKKNDIEDTSLYIMNYHRDIQRDMRNQAISAGFREKNIFSYEELYWI